MALNIGFLGFGEAAQSFCGDIKLQGEATGFDIKLTQPDNASEKKAEFHKHGVRRIDEVAAFAAQVDVVLSVVTADQALTAAKNVADHLRPGSLFLGMNSVSPSTKQGIAEILEARKVAFVDIAIMAPVNPKQLNVPLLIAGRKAETATEILRDLGFSNLRIVGEQVGRASSIKMLRSVMIKGIEALTAECALAADRAGVTQEVFGSMGTEWLEKTNYNLDRMMVHGQRRAAEMNEVVKTLESLGVDPVMSQGTERRQSEIGSLEIGSPPSSLGSKLSRLNSAWKEAAE